MKKPTVFIYVQHLLGVGHLRRVSHLARGMTAAGMKVTVASGGTPVPGLNFDGVKFLQLPPAHVENVRFKPLLNGAGRPVDAGWRDARSRALQHAFEACRPDVLITELYPFGRRMMRFELAPLLAKARSLGTRLVASSVRDVLVAPSRPERVQECVAQINQYYDLVLVHGDPAVITLDETFPGLSALHAEVRYTGYVAPAPLMSSPPRLGDVSASGALSTDACDQDPPPVIFVSAGGGRMGERLIETALRSRRDCPALLQRCWRVFVGAHAGPAALSRYAQIIGDSRQRIRIERWRPDFPALLHPGVVSVSQGGYNTLLEVLSAGADAVVVPYAGGQETEQTVRVARFAARGWLTQLDEATLTPGSLGSALLAARSAKRGQRPALDCGGIHKTVLALQARLGAS